MAVCRCGNDEPVTDWAKESRLNCRAGERLVAKISRESFSEVWSSIA